MVDGKRPGQVGDLVRAELAALIQRDRVSLALLRNAGIARRNSRHLKKSDRPS